MRQGMSQVVKAQIAPHPRHVASDGAICITPHQHFLAIANCGPGEAAPIQSLLEKIPLADSFICITLRQM